MEQKFKRGNLVRILVGHEIFSCTEGKWYKHEIRPQDIGRLAVIQYSYAEKYCKQSRQADDYKKYSIMYQDTGNTVAWKLDHELELVDEGGEHLLKEVDT